MATTTSRSAYIVAASRLLNNSAYRTTCKLAALARRDLSNLRY
jgi:hypothetical protein